MSVREEPEREKKNCPNRALRLAAAAIGVGIGAALYYFVNKREEHPNNEGATSSRWTCENNQSLYQEEQQNAIREQHFRERSWSLEECSVCCEVMLRDQDLKRLPCAHNFHSQCITPWLEEHQTCPNCRKTT